MTKEFLGVGWDFPVRLEDKLEDKQAIKRCSYEEAVANSIWLILSTSKGERVMRPDFGCGIHDLVFSVNDATTSAMIAQEVRQALLLFEPRIDLVDVQVAESPDDRGTLLINIAYLVRSTNNVFNLVYPFHLTGGAR